MMLKLICEAEELVKNETEAKTLITPVPATDDELDGKEVNDDVESLSIEDEEIEEVKPDANTIKNACDNSINHIVQSTWDLISNINGVIATFDFEYPEDNKEEIISILNTIVDDITIDIGMLHKISEMINLKTVNLLTDGEEKAEEIANNI